LEEIFVQQKSLEKLLKKAQPTEQKTIIAILPRDPIFVDSASNPIFAVNHYMSCNFFN
jgi:hypothetical protein